MHFSEAHTSAKAPAVAAGAQSPAHVWKRSVPGAHAAGSVKQAWHGAQAVQAVHSSAVGTDRAWQLPSKSQHSPTGVVMTEPSPPSHTG